MSKPISKKDRRIQEQLESLKQKCHIVCHTKGSSMIDSLGIDIINKKIYINAKKNSISNDKFRELTNKLNGVYLVRTTITT